MDYEIARNLERGTKVRHFAGGPALTVSSVDNINVTCCWWDRLNVYHKEQFYCKNLELVSEEEPVP